jgi:hypothetical protein
MTMGKQKRGSEGTIFMFNCQKSPRNCLWHHNRTRTHFLGFVSPAGTKVQRKRSLRFYSTVF